MDIQLPADLSKYELVGDTSQLGNILQHPVFGVIDLRILTKETADRLINSGAKWIRLKEKNEAEAVDKKVK